VANQEPSRFRSRMHFPARTPPLWCAKSLLPRCRLRRNQRFLPPALQFRALPVRMGRVDSAARIGDRRFYGSPVAGGVGPAPSEAPGTLTLVGMRRETSESDQVADDQRQRPKTVGNGAANR
jgi:hypothetical protein